MFLTTVFFHHWTRENKTLIHTTECLKDFFFSFFFFLNGLFSLQSSVARSLEMSLLLQDVPPEDLPLTRLPRSREALTNPSTLMCVSRISDSHSSKASLTWVAAREVLRLLPTCGSVPCSAPLPGAAPLTLAALASGTGEPARCTFSLRYAHLQLHLVSALSNYYF